jgi:hypothetical protein
VEVDNLVVGGMRACGFPRPALTGLSLVTLPGTAGVKLPSCHLRIGLEEFESALGSWPDEVIVTWIHESVHGRHGPWTAVSSAAQHHRGYEEGLAEGIAQLVARIAGLTIDTPLYPHFVRSYEILATVLELKPEHLYRRLWHVRHARIEDQFDHLVNQMVAESRGRPLSPIARGKLRQAALALFSSRRRAESPDDLSIQREWETAL